jgi:hypothetical protein
MSDISLAIGDDARRMTYAELAEVRGISVPAARRLTLRHHWAKQTGNDGFVRVSVPLSALVKTRKSATSVGRKSDPLSDPEPSTNDGKSDPLSDSTRALQALESAVGTLSEQLTIANQRADRAEHRIEELQTALDAKVRELDTFLEDQRHAKHRWWRWRRA